MNTILNLTQHTATADQLAAGVVDLPADQREYLVELLTVNNLPTPEEINARCVKIAAMVSDNQVAQAMIGGAPWMMSRLERALLAQGITPVYAFSRRESVDQPQADGSVRKVAVFKHSGWVEA